jgi:hypothetical protein
MQATLFDEADWARRGRLQIVYRVGRNRMGAARKVAGRPLTLKTH